MVDARYQLLVWIDEFVNALPRLSRRELGPSASFVEPVVEALDRAREEGDPSSLDPQAFVLDRMDRLAFKRLLRPRRPLDDPWVLEQAAGLAAQVLRSRDSGFRPRHGDLVDAAAAEGMGWVSLIELAKRLAAGEEVENPRGLLRRMIEGDVQRMIDAAMRQAHPGERARYRLSKRLEKRLRHERPDLEPLERRALASLMAREELGLGTGFLAGVAEESLELIFDEEVGVPERAMSDGMVEEIDRLLEDDDLFTPTDRSTWERWKAAGFRGADIDWEGACSRRTGSQRLQALCRKLRRHLTDWRG